MQNITEVMKKYPIDPDNSDSVLQFIVQFFSIMDNDRDLCLALLGPHGDMAFVEQIENLLAETFLKRLPEKLPKNDPNIKYPYAFILNGCVGLIRTWLSCPVKESPDQVAQMTYRFIEDTAQGYLNMQNKVKNASEDNHLSSEASFYPIFTSPAMFTEKYSFISRISSV